MKILFQTNCDCLLEKKWAYEFNVKVIVISLLLFEKAYDSG
jgi:hypothetical protein